MQATMHRGQLSWGMPGAAKTTGKTVGPQHAVQRVGPWAVHQASAQALGCLGRMGLLPQGERSGSAWWRALSPLEEKF